MKKTSNFHQEIRNTKEQEFLRHKRGKSFFLCVVSFLMLALSFNMHTLSAQESSNSPPPAQEEKPDIFWIRAGGGYSYIALAELSSENFLPAKEEFIDHGGAFEASLGIRLWIFKIGVLTSFARFSDYDIGTAVLDLALEGPWTFSPYLRAAFGYGWMGTANLDDPRLSSTRIDGIAGEIGAGFGIRLSPWFSLGAGLDAAFLNLKRQRITNGCGGGDCELFNVELGRPGSATALQLRAAAHLTLLI